jgi:hypothetical protein
VPVDALRRIRRRNAESPSGEEKQLWKWAESPSGEEKQLWKWTDSLSIVSLKRAFDVLLTKDFDAKLPYLRSTIDSAPVRMAFSVGTTVQLNVWLALSPALSVAVTVTA